MFYLGFFFFLNNSSTVFYVIKCMISALAIWSIDLLCNMITVWECLFIPHATFLFSMYEGNSTVVKSFLWVSNSFIFRILVKKNTIFLFKMDVTVHLIVWGTLCLGSCMTLGKLTIWISVFVLKTWRWLTPSLQGNVVEITAYLKVLNQCLAY